MSRRVLVVDDETDTRQLLRLILEKNQFHVTEAADGQIALDALAENEFDLVVLDIRMPGLDGWAVLDAIKTDERWRRIKVVMVSAHTSPDAARNALDRGATAFVTKPFRWDEITSTLERALGA